MDTLTHSTVTKATAAAVKKIMKDRDVSKLALEKSTGIARTTLHRRLSSGDFTVAELEAIGLALEVTPADILHAAQAHLNKGRAA